MSLSTISIVKLELNGARLDAQLKLFIQEQTKLKFSKYYLLVDSQLVWAMIQKDSYIYDTYCGIRIAEIQESTSTKDWYWLPTDDNIADWLTQGKSTSELHEESWWQNGPPFISLPETEWPVEQIHTILEIPYTIKTVMQFETTEMDTLAGRIDITQYSAFIKLIKVTARILLMYQKNPQSSFKNVMKQLTSVDYARATLFWVRDAQSTIEYFERRCTRLAPVTF